jgi:hypothetical protein
VGFANAVVAKMASELPYDPQLSNPNSPVYKKYENAIKQTVDEQMKNVAGYKSTIVKGFSPAVGSRRRRRRRQSGGTVADLQMLFTLKIDVKEVQAVTKTLASAEVTVDGQSYSVSSMAAGDQGNCPNAPCVGSSICLKNLDGEKYCECPEGFEGPVCDQRVPGFVEPPEEMRGKGMMMLSALLMEFPEVRASVKYTMEMSNKMINQLSAVTSFGSFCAISPDDLFMLPPGSTWNYKDWMSRLCSLDVDSLWKEMQQSRSLQDMPGLLEQLNDVQNFNNVTDLLDRLVKIGPMLQTALDVNPTQFKDIIDFLKAMNMMLQAPMAALMQASSMLFGAMESIPELQMALPYMNTVFETVGEMMTMMSGSPESMAMMQRFPNIGQAMSLMKDIPMVMQTAMYTMMTKPMMMMNWMNAMSSWEGFCAFPSDALFSTPIELGSFNMNGFKKDLCTINPELIMIEFTQHPATEGLVRMINGAYFAPVGAKVVQQSFNKMMMTMMGVMADPTQALLNSPMSWVLDTQMWDRTFTQMGKWLMPMFENLHVEGIVNMGMGLFNVLLPDIAIDVVPWYNKAVALANVMMDQGFMVMNTQMINSTFAESQSLQMLYGLLRELPQAELTLMWTAEKKADQLAIQLSQVTSFEQFCAINPDTLFAQHPNSTWDYSNWMARLCSLNIDGLMNEISKISIVTQVENKLSDNYMGYNNLTAVIEKGMRFIGMLDSGVFNIAVLFEPSMYAQLMAQLTGFEQMAQSILSGNFNMVIQYLMG